MLWRGKHDILHDHDKNVDSGMHVCGECGVSCDVWCDYILFFWESGPAVSCLPLLPSVSCCYSI
jgi:hypothetical protein